MAASIDAKIAPKIDPQAMKRAGKKLGDGLERAGQQASKQVGHDLEKQTKKGAKKGTKEGINKGAKEGMSVFKGSFFGSMLGSIAGGIGGIIADGIMSGLEGAEEVVDRLRNRFDEAGQIQAAAQNMGVSSGDLYKQIAAWKVANPNEDAQGYLGMMQQFQGALASDRGSEYSKYAQEHGIFEAFNNALAKSNLMTDMGKKADFQATYFGEDDAIKLNKFANVAGDWYKKNNSIISPDQLTASLSGITTSSDAISRKLAAMAAGQSSIAKQDAQIELSNIMNTNVSDVVKNVKAMAEITASKQRTDEKNLGTKVAWAGFQAKIQNALSNGSTTILSVLVKLYEMMRPFFDKVTEIKNDAIEWVENNPKVIKAAGNVIATGYEVGMKYNPIANAARLVDTAQGAYKAMTDANYSAAQFFGDTKKDWSMD